MATASLDTPLPYAAPAADFDAPGGGSANLPLAVIRRWPWLLVGVIGGVAVGLLMFTQKPAVFQSNAQLLVVKKRNDVTTSSAAPDQRVTVVEDYVSTQVTLLKSQRIMERAANKLEPVSRFHVPPPVSPTARTNFLISQFGVAREREPGATSPTNVLAVSFKSLDPADSQLYLRTIIDAYSADLDGLYEGASTERLKNLQQNITDTRNSLTKAQADQNREQREQLLVTRQDIPNIRGRMASNHLEVQKLEQEKLDVQSRLDQIAAAPATKADRRILLQSLSGGVAAQGPRVSATLTSDSPEDVLLQLNFQRGELLQRLGKDHQDVQALDSKIRYVEKFVKERSGDAVPIDELTLYGKVLQKKLLTIEIQIKKLGDDIRDAESMIEGASRHQIEAERLGLVINELNKTLVTLETSKQEVLNSRTGGYQVNDITKPTDGFQVAPILWQFILGGMIGGLLLGGGLATAIELTDRSFRSPAEIRRRLGLSVLGHIPRLKLDLPPEKPSAAGIEPSIVSFYRPSSVEAEAYRGVRTQLYFSTQGAGHQVVMVTSPNPGDGKSTLAANLAVSIAQSGKRVVLVDCDFRKPRVHKIFKLPHAEIGLASVMSGDADLQRAIQRCEVENLSLLPCGPRPANPAELLTSPKFQDMLGRLRDSFDFVIVDTPPVLAVSDPSAVAPRVDGVLLVFRMTKNARPVAERAREQLDAVGARVLGVVVNASAARAGGYGGYGQSYQYQYQYSEDYHDDSE